jgi:hypothetical protein
MVLLKFMLKAGLAVGISTELPTILQEAPALLIPLLKGMNNAVRKYVCCSFCIKIYL